MELLISEATARKLEYKHKVSGHEIVECFKNSRKEALIDNREHHRTNPPTQWFISQTNAGRELKVIFIQISPMQVVIKSVYEPTLTVKRIYKLRARGRDL